MSGAGCVLTKQSPNPTRDGITDISRHREGLWPAFQN